MGYGIGQLHPQNPGRCIKRRQRDHIPPARRFIHLFRGQLVETQIPQGARLAPLCQQFAGGAAKAGSGNVGFQASPLSAGAAAPVRIDGRVPQFSGRSAGTVQQLAVDDETAPQAGAQCDDEGMVHATGAAELQFSKCGGVGVIGDGGRHVIALPEQRHQIG